MTIMTTRPNKTKPNHAEEGTTGYRRVLMSTYMLLRLSTLDAQLSLSPLTMNETLDSR